MNPAYPKTITVTSNAGTLSWQPATEPQDVHHGHGGDEYAHDGYIFGPVALVERAVALLRGWHVPGLIGYDLPGDDTEARTVSLTYDIDYPLVPLGAQPRPDHTSPAGDILAALIAAHGDTQHTLGEHAEQVLHDYITAAYPGHFDDEDDADAPALPEGFTPSDPIH